MKVTSMEVRKLKNAGIHYIEIYVTISLSISYVLQSNADGQKTERMVKTLFKASQKEKNDVNIGLSVAS